jgi:zinc transporter ZupT
MPLQYLQTLFALAIFLLVIGSGLLPFLKKIKDASHHHDYSFAETVATGIFLGAALLHILPDSNQMFIQQDISYPISYLIAGLTFLFFLWLEHLSKELYQSTFRQHTFIIVAWMMLSVHSFFEGSALGFTKDLSMLAVLFVAIISHKWAEGFAMAVQLTKHDLSHRSNLILYLIYALMTPIGVFLGYHFSGPSSNLFSPVCMAISGGTFLYFGTLHGLERCVLVKGCCNLKHFSFVILGFLLMAIVA